MWDEELNVFLCEENYLANANLFKFNLKKKLGISVKTCEMLRWETTLNTVALMKEDFPKFCYKRLSISVN